MVPTSVYTAGISTNIYPSWTYAAIATGTVTGITQTGANTITATYSGDSNYTGITTTAGIGHSGLGYGNRNHNGRDLKRQPDDAERAANLHSYGAASQQRRPQAQ